MRPVIFWGRPKISSNKHLCPNLCKVPRLEFHDRDIARVSYLPINRCKIVAQLVSDSPTFCSEQILALFSSKLKTKITISNPVNALLHLQLYQQAGPLSYKAFFFSWGSPKSLPDPLIGLPDLS